MWFVWICLVCLSVMVAALWLANLGIYNINISNPQIIKFYRILKCQPNSRSKMAKTMFKLYLGFPFSSGTDRSDKNKTENHFLKLIIYEALFQIPRITVQFLGNSCGQFCLQLFWIILEEKLQQWWRIVSRNLQEDGGPVCGLQCPGSGRIAS